MRAGAALAAGLLAAASVATVRPAPPDGSAIEAASASLSAQIEIEREILAQSLQRYGRAAAARDEAGTALARLYPEADALATGEQEPAGENPGEELERRRAEIARLESERAEALRRAAEALALIRASRERIALLERKHAEIEGSRLADAQPLSGDWQVTYVPTLERGLFVLRQSGTIVTGRYDLDGPDGRRTGSLQGTFTGNRLTLQRIDARLGRSSDLEGTLLEDGQRIRGTWQNYNLSDASPAAGSWTASRRPPAEPPPEPTP